jgi:hypothetical protein
MTTRTNVAKLVMIAGLALSASAWALNAPAQPATTPPATTQPAPARPASAQPTQVPPAQTGFPSDAPGKAMTQFAKVVFESSEKEFGDISDDTTVNTEFKFTNTGSADLEITNTRGSCGCTVPALTKKTFKPGESDIIKVSFNPHGKRGPQHTTVTVQTNDPANPTTTLSLKSNVRPLIVIDPNIIQLGEIERGQTIVKNVSIASRDKNVKPEGLASESPRVSMKMGEASEMNWEGGKATNYPVELTIKPDQGLGPINEIISFKTSKADRMLTLTITGEVVGEVKPTPTRVTFGAVNPEQPYNGELRITSRTGQPFKIEKVEALPAAGTPTTSLNFEVVKEQDSPLQYVIKISGTAPATAGQIRGDLLITTNLEKDKEVKIPYFGFVRGAQAKPRTVDAVPIGKPPSAWEQNPSSLVPSGPR